MNCVFLAYLIDPSTVIVRVITAPSPGAVPIRILVLICVVILQCIALIPPFVLKVQMITIDLTHWVSTLVAWWVSYSANSFGHIKGNINILQIHSNIVMGHQLLCDAHTVSYQQGKCCYISKFIAVILFCFFYLCVCQSDSPYFFSWGLGASYNLCWEYNEGRRFVLLIPSQESLCAHPWQQNDLMVFMLLVTVKPS